MKFRQKHDTELKNLSDGQLVDYIIDARDAGRTDAMSTAIGIFSYRREPMILAKIGLKNVPAADREEVFMEVIASCLGAGFKGVSTGELVNLIKRITQFRIADYFEANKAGLRNRADDDDRSILDLVLENDDGYIEVETRDLIASVLASRSEIHREVIGHREHGYSSRETATLVGNEMTPPNVDKIFSRYNRDLRAAIEEVGEMR